MKINDEVKYRIGEKTFTGRIISVQNGYYFVRTRVESVVPSHLAPIHSLGRSLIKFKESELTPISPCKFQDDP